MVHFPRRFNIAFDYVRLVRWPINKKITHTHTELIEKRYTFWTKTYPIVLNEESNSSKIIDYNRFRMNEMVTVILYRQSKCIMRQFKLTNYPVFCVQKKKTNTQMIINKIKNCFFSTIICEEPTYKPKKKNIEDNKWHTT